MCTLACDHSRTISTLPLNLKAINLKANKHVSSVVKGVTRKPKMQNAIFSNLIYSLHTFKSILVYNVPMFFVHLEGETITTLKMIEIA